MLTNKDRIRLLREKKLAHTLKKREQQGYMDADDYGTVPFPDGYSFSPIPNSPNGGFYGYEGMADNFCALLAQHPVYVDPLERLCCRWRDMLSNYRQGLRWDEIRFPYDTLKPEQALYGIIPGIENDAHLACDYRIGLTLGFPGLLEKIRHFRELNGDPEGFYQAEERVLLAILDFIRRHNAEIRRLISIETRTELKESLKEMLAASEAMLKGPPTTFHEACQWVAYFNCVSRIYTRDGAGFQLDSLLLPFYEKDLEEGRLDRDTARFLLANLLLIDPHYYQISGVDEDGQDLTNDLSWLILEAAHELNIAVNLTIRVHPNCDLAFLRKAVEYLFEDRNGWPRFCGDKSLAEGYIKNGVDISTARNRIAVGCHWMAVPGLEFPMNDTVKINIAKVLEIAIRELRASGNASSCEKLFQIFTDHLKRAVEVTAAGINLHLDHQWQVTPELIMNLMVKNPLEQGKDISLCAELFTIGVDGAGLAVVADSFGAMEQRIEQEGRLTWDALYRALDENFSGTDGERIRLMLSSSNRYCQGDSLSDHWAKRITETFARLVKEQPMPGKRQLIPGWFSWSLTIQLGQQVGATPNGRKAGTPISHGANPNPGFRKDGAVTAMSNGIAMVQPGYGNTAPLQLEFDPRMTAEEGGVDRVLDLIRTHFELGGTLININVLDGEKLLAAHKDPDLYPDLVVRVTGFTAYFATLSPEFRQLVVDRFLNGF